MAEELLQKVTFLVGESPSLKIHSQLFCGS